MKAVVDRIVQYANRYKLTNAETGEVLGTFDFDEVTGTVQQVGTEIDAELFDSIAADLAARVVSNGGDLKDTVVTFTDTTGTAANVASGDKTSTLWSKVKNWFSRLKALAFKDKISNADVSNDAAIAQSKISGLESALDAKANNADLAAIAKSGDLADATQDATHRVVTDTEKAAWNGKANTSGTYPNLTVGKATNATRATQDGNGANIANTYAKQNGSYPTLGAGYLAKRIVVGSLSSQQWIKFAEIRNSQRSSVLFIVNGLNNSIDQRSGLLEAEFLNQSGTILGAQLKVLCGSIETSDFCCVVTNGGIDVYATMVAYRTYAITLISDVDSSGFNDTVTLMNIGTGSTTAPDGAVYAVNRNVARPLFLANDVQAKTPTVNTDITIDGGVNPDGAIVGDEVIFYCSSGGNYTCTGKIKSISGTTPTVTITGVVEQQASGGEVTSSGGFQGGTGANATYGGAVGSNAETIGGGAVGRGASATTGGAVGEHASAQNGGAVGSDAETESGGAVGATASAQNGGAVGYRAQASSGGAVGEGARATTGFAGGYNAKAADDGAVQLGEGTNNTANTLNFRSYQLCDASGNIPAERLSNAATPAQVNLVSMVPYGGKATTLTARASGGVYNISENGYLRIAYQTTATDNFITMKQVDSSGADMWGALSNGIKSYGSGWPFIFMPVAAGDHIKVEFGASVNIVQVQLIKVKGV